MNIIGLTGNATKDIELKYTQGGMALVSGTIAVRRDFKNKQTNEYETDFINFTAFGKTGEIMANHIRKGSKFGINGRLQIRTWDDDQGKRNYFTEVIVNGFDFPDKPKEDRAPKNEQQAPQQERYQKPDNDPFSTEGGAIPVGGLPMTDKEVDEGLPF